MASLAEQLQAMTVFARVRQTAARNRVKQNERLRQAFEDEATATRAAREAFDEWDADGASAGLGIQCYQEELRAAIERREGAK